MVLAPPAQSLAFVYPRDLSLISHSYTRLSPFLSSQSPPGDGNALALVSLAELPYLIKASGESDVGGSFLAFLSSFEKREEFHRPDPD